MNKPSLLLQEAYYRTLHEAAPYVRQHNGITAIVHIPAACCTEAILRRIIKEIKIVQQFGTKIVLVHGVRGETSTRALTEAQLGLRWREIISIRARIEKVMGSEGYLILNGMSAIRFKSHGLNRGSVSVPSPDVIKAHAKRSLVLFSPIGSSGGSSVVVSSYQAAKEFALSLKARKLICLSDKQQLFQSKISAQLTISELKPWLRDRLSNSAVLASTINEAIVAGVMRAHIINAFEENSLLKELYTREGSGVLIRKGTHQTIRKATDHDVDEIHWLLQNPKNIARFRQRSRRQIARFVQRYLVAVLDGAIVGLCEVIRYPRSPQFEIGAVCIDESYKNRGIVRMLFNRAEREILQQKGTSSFVLTTGLGIVFKALGYKRTPLSELPKQRRRQYDSARNPVLLVKNLRPN